MKIKLLLACLAMGCGSNPISAQSSNLAAAARANDVHLVMTLLDANANVNQIDEQGYSPLILATYNDSFEVAQILLKHGANIEARDRSGRTALMGASFKGNDREVKLLLDNGANPAASDSKGMTSMMYAVIFGKVSVIRTLRASEAAKPTANQQSAGK